MPFSFCKRHGVHLIGIVMKQVILFFVFMGLLLSHALAEQLEFVESKYNNIYVTSYDGLIAMSFGHNRRFYTESVYDPKDNDKLPVTYTRYMTVGLAYKPDAKNLVEIGLGGGRTATYLYQNLPHLDVTAVELDAEVVRMAVKHFGVKEAENFDVKIMDGRRYLRTNDTVWDLVLLDAYRGPFVPFHLLTKEFYELIEKRLAKDGVIVQNVEPTTMVFEAAIKTISSVFENIDLYRADGNVVVIAYNGPKRDQSNLIAQGTKLSNAHKLKYSLEEMISQRRVLTKLPNSDILTDDFAPVDSLLAISRHNRKMDEFAK